MIYDRTWASRTIQDTTKTKFVFFWGDQVRPDGVLTDTVFSQWFPADMMDDAGQTYPTAEHFMMAEKARIFGDDATRAEILQGGHPGRAKALGQAVAGFDQAIWDARKIDIVIRGNLLKFSQDSARCDHLLRTGDKILVEASPTDTIWGAGLAKSDPRARTPDQWPGTNLLGFALMHVRDRLRQSQEPSNGR